MDLSSLFPAPSVTTTLANVLPGAYSIFQTFQGWMWLAIIIPLGFGAIAWLIHLLGGVFNRMTHRT